MFRLLFISFFFLLCSVGICLAQERKILFEGFGGTLMSQTDSMNDKVRGILVLDMGRYDVAISGHDGFSLLVNQTRSIVTNSKHNMIRPQGLMPIPLIKNELGNSLTAVSRADSTKIIRSITRGEDVRVRYFDVISNEIKESTLSNKASGFLYSKAASQFGWKRVGQIDELPQVEIKVYVGKDTDGNTSGYFSARPDINNSLILRRIRQLGQSVFFEVGWPSSIEVFGHNGSQWIGMSIVGESAGIKILVKDKDGRILYEGSGPAYDRWDRSLHGVAWVEAENVAKAVLAAGPMGSIKVFVGTREYSSPLYGFKELWDWGVQNATLPKILE
jgi:hypothetical protein